MYPKLVTGKEEPRVIEVSEGRLERTIEVLGYMAVDVFDHERLEIEEVDDHFGELEQALRVFAEEYAEAVRSNQQMAEERARMIEKLRGAVSALSTPIIDVWDGVVSLPIAGSVDAERAAEMTERLLARVRDASARCVIVDITGVDELDATTAAHLVRMVRATQLLGAYTLVSGVQPSVARALVELDLLTGEVGFKTVRSLREGLRECIAQLEKTGARSWTK